MRPDLLRFRRFTEAQCASCIIQSWQEFALPREESFAGRFAGSLQDSILLLEKEMNFFTKEDVSLQGFGEFHSRRVA